LKLSRSYDDLYFGVTFWDTYVPMSLHLRLQTLSVIIYGYCVVQNLTTGQNALRYYSPDGTDGKPYW